MNGSNEFDKPKRDDLEMKTGILNHFSGWSQFSDTPKAQEYIHML